MAASMENLITRVMGKDVKSGGLFLKKFKISKGNQKLILDFDERLKNLRNRSGETRWHYMITLARLAEFVGDKSLAKLNRGDFEAYFEEKAHMGKEGPSSVNSQKVCLRRYYRYLLGDGEEYPKIVRGDAFRLLPENNEKTSTDLLTREEILRMVKACDHPRDSALIMTLYEGALRRGEVVSCRIKDLVFGEEYATLTIPSNGSPAESGKAKTGSYKAFLEEAVPFLQRYLDQHPHRNDPDAPLFYSYGKNNFGQPLEVHGVYHAVRRIAKRAGITKRIYPHLFRFTQNTEWARKGFTAEQINLMSGRRQGSQEAQRYIRLSGRDVENAWREKKGFKKPETDKGENPLKGLECWACHVQNPPLSKFCFRCGRPLSPQTDKMLLIDATFVKLQQFCREDPKMAKKVIEGMFTGMENVLKQRGEIE